MLKNFISAFIASVTLGIESSFADEYYWQILEYDDNLPHAKYSSPEEACRWALTEMDAYLQPPRLGSTLPGWIPDAQHPEKEPGWACSYNTSPEQKFWIDGGFSIVRKGDNCADGKEFNRLNGRCEFTLINDMCPTTETGNPINFATGYKTQTEIDYFPSANKENINGVKFSRTYNSKDGHWRHSYSDQLIKWNNTITISTSDGQIVLFTEKEGSYTPKNIRSGNIFKNGSDWLYLSPTNTQYTFNAEGKLTRITAKGVSKTLEHNGGKIKISDIYGHTITVTEDNLSQPLTMMTDTLKIDYSYDDKWQLIAINKTYEDHIESIKFLHEDERNDRSLTGIINAMGIRYATWTYDDLGRAISSEHAGGSEKVEVTYNDDVSTTVVNPLGKSTTYRFKFINGVKRITAIEGEPTPHCSKSNSIFAYDSQGLLKVQTDNKGNMTTFEYNDKGQEVSRTEASGTPQARVVSTKWHPTFNLPTEITEPLRVTRYTYDDQGRQLSQIFTPR